MLKILFATMIVIAGCGDSDYNSSSSTSGSSPVEQSSVQEVLDCSSVVQSETIEMRANTFSPGTGTITRGQIVRFSNFDPESHTVTSGGPNTQDKLFDITLSPTGIESATRCLKFTVPGSFPFFDKLNPLQNGVIIVQ